jgi:uncharacterized protein
MLITTTELAKDSVDLHEQIAKGAIDYTADVLQTGPLAVDGRADLLVEHRGPKETVEDIRVRARYEGEFELLCARCLEPVEQTLAGHFDLIFRPEDADVEAGERAITEEETEIGYYQGDGLLLEDVLREQVLLALPGRILCKDDCQGLCPHCGANRNQTACTCAESHLDPRWGSLKLSLDPAAHTK